MEENKKTPSQKIVFFDGICHLCNGFVDFVIQNETLPGSLVFAPLQGETAAKILPEADRKNMDSVLVWSEGRILRESEAVLFVLLQLKSPWNWIPVFTRWIPASLRDFIYRFVARNRYKWFGVRDQCRLPLPHEKAQLWP